MNAEKLIKEAVERGIEVDVERDQNNPTIFNYTVSICGIKCGLGKISGLSAKKAKANVIVAANLFELQEKYFPDEGVEAENDDDYDEEE